MKTAANSNLKYLAGSAKLKSAQPTIFDRNSLYSHYKINPALFENSANLIGELVNANNETIIGKGDLLLVYTNNEPRGVTEAIFVPELNRYVFILTMFSNTSQEKLSFRYKSLTQNSEEVITEELIFKTDEIYGKPMNPIALHLSNATGIKETGADPTISIYPNPVYDELQIISQSEIKSVTLSGLSGNSIQLLSNISEYDLKLDTRTLVPGIYMLKVETSKGIVIRKLVKSTNR